MSLGMPRPHYSDVIMDAMVSQITSLTTVYATVYSGADQRKHLRSASLAFVRGIHRWPVNSPHKWPVTRKFFPFDDGIMFTIAHVLRVGFLVIQQIHVYCEIWADVSCYHGQEIRMFLASQTANCCAFSFNWYLPRGFLEQFVASVEVIKWKIWTIGHYLGMMTS